MFPGATADRPDAEYVIVGAPLDVSTTFQPGTRFGPAELRRHARSFEDYDHHNDVCFSDCRVHDSGDCHAWDDAREYLEFLSGTLGDVHDDEAVPVLIGGEHTVSVAGVRATRPDVFVTCDAHLDLRTSFDGNPLSHATVTQHALEVVDHAYIVGARSGSRAEWDRAARDDVTVIEPPAVDAFCADLSFGDRSVYCSIDIDAADPSLAPGTGTMEPFGLDGQQLDRLVRAVAPNAVGFDVVEVNDRDHGQAATLGAKLLRSFVTTHATNRTPEV